MSMDLMHGLTVRVLWQGRLMGAELTLTNASLSMLLACLFMSAALLLMLRRPTIVPDHWQLLAESYYLFIRDVTRSNITHGADAYVPVMFTLFTFVVGCNLIGLVPGSFGPNTQIVVTGTLAVSVFLFSIVIRVRTHGWAVLRMFAPRGVPLFVLPLIVPIEMISFLARPVTLAVRLFANMTAGHTALTVLALLGWSSPWFVLWMPLGFSMVQIAMESIIAVIQAYIFMVLSCVYIDDALVGH